MSEVIRFVSKSERERARLIRRARAIYESVFPSGDPGNDRPGEKSTADHAVLCALSGPQDCHELLVTSSDFADISVQSCLMGAPQLAEWMKQYPTQRLAAWRCIIGKQDRRGA